MSWGVYLALALALASIVMWVVAVALAVSTWKRLRPTITAYIQMFSSPDA